MNSIPNCEMPESPPLSFFVRFAGALLGLLAVVGNAFAALTINSVTLNGGTSVTVLPNTTITVVVSETNNNGSNWGSTRFRTNPATVSTCVDTPNHNGDGTYSETFTVTAPAAAGTYDASFRASSSNACGGTNSGTFTLTGGIIVYVPPAVTSINRASFDPTAANTTVTWTVVFNRSVTGVDVADFALVQSGGATGAAISAVTGSGTTWTVTANTGTGSAGTVRLDLIDNDTVVSGGTPLGGAGLGNGNFTGQAYTLLTVCTGVAPQIFCDDFERTNAGAVGNGWAVIPANVTNCTGGTGNTGCAGIDSDIPPFSTYANPRANSTRSMFTRWAIVSVDSPTINLASTPAAILSFWIRRGSDTFSECPEAAGENYLVQYLDSAGTWQILAQFPSSPSTGLCGTGVVYTPVIQLPPGALHANFKLRFYQPSGSGRSGGGGAPGVVGYDYWHMDNIVITEAPTSSYVGAFCDNFEGGLGRWSFSAEGGPFGLGTPTGPAIGDASLNTTDFLSAGHELDMRWGYVVASTLRTDMTGVSGNISYWLKRGTTNNRAPDVNENMVVEYYNNAGSWINLATYTSTNATAGAVTNGSHVLPDDAKHSGFRLRYRMLVGSGYDFDYWHLDDVCVGTILPTADLSMTMSRSGALVPGANVSYSLNVTNNGPEALAGSLEIVDTLPIGLSYFSAAGSGWSCSASGQIVTCGWSGTLATGAAAPALTLTTAVALSAAGTITNAATVTGTVIDSIPANNTATNSGTVIVALQLAEYHLEEMTWNGTAGEVIDTAGYAGGPYNGTALVSSSPLPTLAVASPARGGNPGTCGYAAMPGPAANGGAFTITGLPVSTNAGDKTSVAFWMYWDGTENVMPVGWGQHDLWLQNGFFGFNTANTDIYGISSAGLANGWHHVVAVFTNGSVDANQLYIDGAAQTLIQQQGVPNLANAVVGTTLRLGGWTLDNTYRFSGRLDEVMVYKDALVQADVTAIYNETHVCVAAVDHYELTLPTSSIACLSSTATVTACANNTSPCTSPSGAVNGMTATLAVTPTSTATLGTATVAFNSVGVASTTLSYPALPADNTPITVTLSGEQVVAINSRTCCPDGANCVVANSCNTVFDRAGFVVAAAANNVVAATVPDQVAGTSSGTYYLRAVRTSDNSSHTCGAALTGAQSVNLGYECNNPATCYSSNLMSVNGGTSTTIARNSNGSVSSYTAVDMSFDANGNAPFTFNYSDVGQVRLYAQKTLTAAPPVTATTLTGSTNSFVVKPAGFVLSAIERSVAPNLANPAAANAAGAAFVKAGEAFSATVTAVTATGATAYNYGREIAPEGARLIPVLAASLGLTANPGINNSNAFGTFSNGVATGTTFSWDEVGIISLIPGVADSDYLGAGDTQCNPELANYGGAAACPSSGNVGRFYPDHFDTVVAQVSNVPMACPGSLGFACPAAFPGFVYSGQPFSLSVTAMSASGLPTANYNATSGFAKATTLGAFGGLGVTTAPTGAGALGVASVSAFAAGTLTVAAESYTFGTTPTAATNIYIRATDGEASSMRVVNPTTTSVEGGVAVASGRIRVSSAYGSEQLPLPITATVQYYNAAGAWLTSTTDNVTAFNPATDLLVAIVKVPLAAGNIVVTNIGSVTVAGGIRAFQINRPGVSGSANISLSSPAFLQSIAGRVTFGVYKGANQFIYQRETY